MARPTEADNSRGIYTITLKVDEVDYRAIQAAIATHKQECPLPPALHDDANFSGRRVAEICRRWMGFLGEWKWIGDENDEQEQPDGD